MKGISPTVPKHPIDETYTVRKKPSFPSFPTEAL